MTLIKPSQLCITEITEEIPLLPQEQYRLCYQPKLREGWEQFNASVPLPALFVSAHIDMWLTQKPDKDQLGENRYSNQPKQKPIDAISQLRRPNVICRSLDDRVNEHRIFLQKLITRLNRTILKSRSADKTFSFRGTVERNINDTDGSKLHFHFFLWGPDDFFLCDPAAITTTSAALSALWITKVNNLGTSNYKPIDIQTVTNRDDATRIARYMHKDNPMTMSYELFDDWSTSRSNTARAGSGQIIVTPEPQSDRVRPKYDGSKTEMSRKVG
jgi:hypothetical protein